MANLYEMLRNFASMPLGGYEATRVADEDLKAKYAKAIQKLPNPKWLEEFGQGMNFEGGKTPWTRAGAIAATVPAGFLMGAMMSPNILTSVNPTGKVFAKYAPQERMTAKLGKNITTLDKTAKKPPNTLVTIYRGTIKGQSKINPGDFVTTNPNLAKDYAGAGKVLKMKVKISNILDDLTEPLGEEYIYRPTGK